MKPILIIALLALAASPLSAGTNEAPVKLAIISESPDAATAADLLTAEFSKNKTLQLLERSEIEKVVREQQLSLNNLDRLKLGQMLGADGLLALQVQGEGTNQFLSAQLVAVRPGVLLADERFNWPLRNVTDWSQNIAGQFDSLLPKLNVLAKDAIPISVVNFHAAVQSSVTSTLERQLSFLVIERLAHEKNVFVLERKRMQSLSEEKERAGTEAEPFWNGKYLLDGTIDRDGSSPDLVSISARLIPPGGPPILIEASGSRTNYTEVANQLVEKVLTTLKINPDPAAWNTADEANKFFQESQWCLAWGMFPQARLAAEAAWALGKHDAATKILRVRTFMPPPDGGIIYYPPREKPSSEKIDDALQALRLYQDFSRNLPVDEPKPDSDWYRLGLDNLTIATRVLQQFNWSPEYYQPVREKLAELRAESRSLAGLLSRSPAVRDGYFVGNRVVKYDELYHFEEKPGIYGLKLEGGCLWQETPADEVALYRELMSSPVFRYLHERFWFRDADHSSSRVRMPPRLVAWNEADQKRLPEIWSRFIEELNNSLDVFLQMEARALRLADVRFPDMNRSFDTRAASEAAYRAAHQTYDKELAAAFTDFFDAFVANRLAFRTNNVDVLYLDWGVGDLVQRMGGDIVTDTKETLKNRYRTEYAAKLAAKDAELQQQLAEREAALRKNFTAQQNVDAFARQKQFLQDRQPFDPGSFMKLFIFGFKDYSREQAQEIKPLLAEYKKHLSGNLARIGEMQVGQVEASVENLLNPKAVTTPSPNRSAMANGNPMRSPGGNFPAGRPAWPGQPGIPPPSASHRFPPDRPAEASVETPAPEPLVSSNIVTVRDYYFLPTNNLPGDKPHEFRFTCHRLVEGKLLLDFRYKAWIYSFNKNGDWQSSADKTFIGMAVFAPDSKRWTVAALPEPFSEPLNFLPQQSVLWQGDLYSSHTGKVRKYNSRQQAWEPAGFAVEGGWQFFNLDGRLFITDYNSIQEVIEHGRATKLLASIQRQPPATSLDSQGALMKLALFLDQGKNLWAAVHNKVYRWEGVDWKEIGSAPASFQPSDFDGGVLLFTDGWNQRPASIARFDKEQNSVKMCLVRDEASYPGAISHAKPQWKLPAGMFLPNLSAALQGADLLLLTDHSEQEDITKEERGTLPDGTVEVNHVIIGKTIKAKDGYNSALYWFTPGVEAASLIRIQFDNQNGCPPMAGLGVTARPMTPQFGITTGWMLISAGMLFCGREQFGGNAPGSSDPDGFKPGIWVTAAAPILSEVNRLKKEQAAAQAIRNSQAERQAQAAAEKGAGMNPASDANPLFKQSVDRSWQDGGTNANRPPPQSAPRPSMLPQPVAPQ